MAALYKYTFTINIILSPFRWSKNNDVSTRVQVLLREMQTEAGHVLHDARGSPWIFFQSRHHEADTARSSKAYV